MQLVGAGRDADVFALDGNRVLRRYRDAGRSAEREAAVMAHARSAGLPVPEVFDVDGADLVLERVVGPTMTSALARRPWSLAAAARVLAGLHRAVHEVPAPDWLPGQGDGGGAALLHLDLHPENVLLGPEGPVVIDWTNAARGRAELDVADAWLVMSTGSVPGGRLQTVVVGAAQGTFARLFRRAAGLDLTEALPAAATRRLADRNLSARERQRVRRLAGVPDG
ncbi:Phosphotransferase enzyme family protein [Blastococcus aurantiacus]|uniref:Phosphotransferase enzyme family protein n=1 Tax=Blastococcus aurantiacus TaxID=1550231 RepID=A0A1G7NGM9_9ACTN|nr:phosphotransferase [Blastococcus aurantiacus]SDF73183.1 Phosphotransferase enzyme family protein [Blastococcus aurantiacus]